MTGVPLCPVRLSVPGTRVWGLYGWGDNFAGSSSGIDEIAAQARMIPNVEFVRIRNYHETSAVANEIMDSPPESRIVMYGYSCGANAMPVICTGTQSRPNKVILGIQQSVWCGGDLLHQGVLYAQLTQGSFIETWGFGSKPYEAADDFTGSIVHIRRPELEHMAADNDPDAQADVLSGIAQVASYQPEQPEPPPEGGVPPETGEHPPPPEGGVPPPPRFHLHYGHGGMLVVHGAIKIKTGTVMVEKGVTEIIRHHGEVP